MKLNRVITAVVILSRLLFAADAKTQQEGVDLVRRAIDRTNIFALPSFSMKANLRVNSQGRGDLDGTYLLLWNGPDQWREQIQFSDYAEIRVGAKGTVYLKRSLDFIPLEIYEVRSALGFGSSPGFADDGAFFGWSMPGKDETVKSIHPRNINGMSAKCIETSVKDGGKREVCVADSTGALLRDNSYRDSDFVPIGTKFFPRYMSHIESGKTVASVEVSDLKEGVTFPAKSFDIPPDASLQPGCMNPERPTVTGRVAPHYPERERAARMQGTAWIDMTIGANGVPTNLRTVSSTSPGFAQAAIDAFKGWRYDPAKCGTVPISVETLVSFRFTLSF